MQTTGISFKRYNWPEIPVDYQDQLAGAGLDKICYDTGKLLNLALLLQGVSLVFQASSSLGHIGGISSTRHRFLSQSILRGLMSPLYQQSKELKRAGLSLAANLLRHQTGAELTSAEKRQRQIIRKRKSIVSSYFTTLLYALSENQPLPSRPTLNDIEIEENVSWMTIAIMDLYLYHCRSTNLSDEKAL
jgi:hypothetical protein